MRILYDGHIYSIRASGGINRYFSNLIDRLPENIIPTLTTNQIRDINYPQHPNLKRFFYQRYGFKPGRVCYWLEKYYFQAVNYFNYFNVLHPTYYSLLSGQNMIESKYSVVLTVHDMIHELFAKQIDPKHEQAKIKKMAITAANAIICVSENTKKDLLERYPFLEEKVTTIYLASEIDASMAYGDEKVPLQPYYLYIGGRDTYKNFDLLLIAFAKINSLQPELKLCVVGSVFKPEEYQRINELKVAENIVHYGRVSDLHLAKLYRCSIALVYPSLYEGFGIPPLEAMSCGTALIASNTSSIPEVVGDAGILFNPYKVDELVDILLFLLNNSLERDRLITKGHQRAKFFNWEQTVDQTLKVYQSTAIS